MSARTKQIALLIITLSYDVPASIKSVYLFCNGAGLLMALLSAVTLIMFSCSNFFLAKGNIFCKYASSLFLLAAGGYMSLLFFIPIPEAVAIKIFLGSYGIFWIASSFWIFRNYPIKKKESQ
jgi:hypothetical protein